MKLKLDKERERARCRVHFSLFSRFYLLMSFRWHFFHFPFFLRFHFLFILYVRCADATLICCTCGMARVLYVYTLPFRPNQVFATLHCSFIAKLTVHEQFRKWKRKQQQQQHIAEPNDNNKSQEFTLKYIKRRSEAATTTLARCFFTKQNAYTLQMATHKHIECNIAAISSKRKSYAIW